MMRHEPEQRTLDDRTKSKAKPTFLSTQIEISKT
jgi:hypothetical protein